MLSDIVILAAGQARRMRSGRGKLLQTLAGKPLLQHLLDTVSLLPKARLHLVAAPGARGALEAALDFGTLEPCWVEQSSPQGTGDALACAAPGLVGAQTGGTVLVLCGDVPLVRHETLAEMLRVAGEGSTVALLSAIPQDPAGYGRIIRNADGMVEAIVEDSDADAEQRTLGEIHTGAFALPAPPLADWLAALDDNNAQGEKYLPDLLPLARSAGYAVQACTAPLAVEVLGVNDRAQLALLERHCQRRQADALMREGLGLADPARFDLRGELSVGRDVFIDINVVLEGVVELGDRVYIEPNCVLRDVCVGDDCVIRVGSLLEGAEVAAGSTVGPYARLRPGSSLGIGVQVGNFVEIKKSTLGAGSKVNHLSYVGDAQVGERANIGAGVITCNYDGQDKHPTWIGDRAFIGSNSALVAPVQVGDGAVIGAGSVITTDVPEDNLGVGRGRQRNVADWATRRKRQNQAEAER